MLHFKDAKKHSKNDNFAEILPALANTRESYFTHTLYMYTHLHPKTRILLLHIFRHEAKVQ